MSESKHEMMLLCKAEKETTAESDRVETERETHRRERERTIENQTAKLRHCARSAGSKVAAHEAEEVLLITWLIRRWLQNDSR